MCFGPLRIAPSRAAARYKSEGGGAAHPVETGIDRPAPGNSASHLPGRLALSRRKQNHPLCNVALALALALTPLLLRLPLLANASRPHRRHLGHSSSARIRVPGRIALSTGARTSPHLASPARHLLSSAPLRTRLRPPGSYVVSLPSGRPDLLHRTVSHPVPPALTTPAEPCTGHRCASIPHLRYINMSTANPRRRPARSSSPSSMTLIDSFQSMSIRKGDTFHPNASAGSKDFWDPLESRAGATLPPPRSSTCPKSLEDLLLGAGERRTAELLRKVDKAVKDRSKAALSNVLAEHEVLPVPAFAVHDTDATLRKTRTHSHGSDSGIGSSIASLDAKTLTGEHLASSLLTLASSHTNSPPRQTPPTASHWTGSRPRHSRRVLASTLVSRSTSTSSSPFSASGRSKSSIPSSKKCLLASATRTSRTFETWKRL